MGGPNPAAQERVYQGLKSEIRESALRPGQGLEAQIIADRYGTSITPVRDAMYRLLGEGTLELHPQGGFQLAALSEAQLRDLYGWHGDLLRFAISDLRVDPSRIAALRSEIDKATDMPDIAATLFLVLAEARPGDAFRQTLLHLEDRLYPIRRTERLVLDGLQAELAELMRLAMTPDHRILRRAITAYHRRRIARVADILAMHMRPAQ